MEESNQELNKGDYMVGLDIGTTKISIMIGRKNQYDKLEILGTGRAVSNGVARGIVANIDKTVISIKEADKQILGVCRTGVFPEKLNHIQKETELKNFLICGQNIFLFYYFHLAFH